MYATCILFMQYTKFDFCFDISHMKGILGDLKWIASICYTFKVL